MIYPIALLAANRQNLGTSFKTQIGVTATTGALKRFSFASFSIGPADVPNATDCSLEVDVARSTTIGTATTYTTPFMQALETGTQDPPAATMRYGHTVEPTITASSSIGDCCFGMNQRGLMRWVAVDKEAKPTAPAVADSGLVLRALSTNYALKCAGGVNFRE